MLKLQEFCAFFPNEWKERLSAEPYCLKIKEQDNLVLFKYNQIDSDFNEPICKEARGIILEKGTWRVVRKAFDKFFNIDEKFAAQIDWDSATATQKEDGTLISLYFYNDKWNVATNTCIDASEADVGETNINFKGLFNSVAAIYKLDYNKLNEKYTYTFEICSGFNQVVVKYDKPQLFHILTINNETLEEVERDIGIPKPQKYQLNNELEYRQLIEDFPSNTEGIVIKDKFNNRVKIKTKEYFALHKIANNGHVDLEYALELIRKNDHEEFLSYFPCHKPYFDFVIKKYEQAAQDMKRILDDVIPFKLTNTSRKDFALTYKDNKLFPAYMLAWDNKLEGLFYTVENRNFIKIFKIDDSDYEPFDFSYKI